MPSYADIIKKKKKDWSCEDLMSSAKGGSISKIPFSSPLMNWATYGGVPRGRITEFFGEPGSGKSSSAVDICKNAIEVFQHEHEAACIKARERIAAGDSQARVTLEDLEEQGPRKVLYIDLEHGFDSAWSEVLGIDSNDIDIMQPPNIDAEELLQTTEDLVCTGEVGLIVFDSIPSLVTKSELEKKYGERTVASLAGLLTVFTRKIVSLLTRYDCTLIFINQTRDNMDNPYVVQTPGGKAVKFYSSLRMFFRLGVPVDFLGNDLPTNTENPAGYIINVKLMKQKTAPYDRKNATYYLMCKSGIRPDFDYAKLATTKYNIIRKAGAWFTICDPTTGEVFTDDSGKVVKLNGMAKVYQYLSDNPDYFEKLKTYIEADINGKTDEEVEANDYAG